MKVSTCNASGRTHPATNAILEPVLSFYSQSQVQSVNRLRGGTQLCGAQIGRASLRVIFGAFLDRLQPHSPNQGASRINHPPVLAELATRGWVGSKHTSVRCNDTSVRPRFFDQEVHGRQCEAGRVERLEVVGSWLLVWPPACGGAHQCTDDDLTVGLIGKQEKP